ncbi:hypothetical protein M472_16990 [Sphingobacterium paucimobilis HER1398]|uniref:Uncharacterized protein n=1 Tax=Sphingobacterium paucimobilis HER1398 TaxID=1346330 RepID=U2HFA4_9SPHI|nr:hypothetical protein M472_16990 [Sphingobacterium paucimobilis HER1398]
MKEILPEAKKQIVVESIKGVFLLAKENIQDLFN